MSKPRRPEFTAALLKDPAARPAIVYAPSRKAAEELAVELNRALGLQHRSRLPRGHRVQHARARAARLPVGQTRGRRRHHCVWHGHRQGRRAHRRPHRAARVRSKPSIRRSAAPDATACPAAPSCCTDFADRKMHEFLPGSRLSCPPAISRESPPSSPMSSRCRCRCPAPEDGPRHLLESHREAHRAGRGLARHRRQRPPRRRRIIQPNLGR
jgi:hypothetical protein